ncbi:tenascin-like isoform X1 [Heterodontus francisci]|uniref:tenascin-like isoform X1 n=1 Tax=Heterodontus francisci TaxID=7792 RepID=UPI00355BDAAD
MGLAFKILLLFVAVSLDRGDCGVFVKTIRQRRALLPNITSGRPTTVNHVYNIRLPDCKSWSANLSKPLARIFEAQDEARDDKRFEHTVDPTNQVVFTHRINIPPQVCGCDDIQALLSRLEVLEKQVATLRQQCSSNACCGAKRALDCGAHGTFSASTCGCVCEEGWSGPHCSEASCPANCQGDCVAGRCVCQAGFTGKDCSEEICPDNCNDQGRCINDKCVCFPGYTGHGCTEETCPDDCKGRGRCVDGSCVCKEGYSGPDCGIVACPGDCNGQGRCVEGRCICNAGFSGRDCGLRGCPANCHGRGRCVNGKCICGKGFTGSDCGVKACPQNCNDRGQCVNGKCVCRKGFTGSDCGVKACPQNCNDRGQCVNGKCVCRKGFTGSDCGVKACPQNCNDRGQCVNGKCVCRKGFTGSDCGVKACPQNCNDRGQCVNGKCVCRKGFTGSDCGVKTCPQNCNDRGQCVNGKCVCNSGFSGPACSVQTCPNNCSQQGQCINGKCVCNKGYSGPKCGVQDCLNNCNNRGRCVDRKCICKDGFTGNDCSIEIPAPIGLHVKKILETKVTVEWQLPRVPVDGWKITFQPLKEDNGKLTNRVAGSKTSFQQTGLASGQEYEVTLQAEKDKKQGPGVSRTLTTLIDGPRNLHVVSATNSTIKLGWNRPQASIDRYRLNYSSATGKHSQVVVPPGDSSAVLTGLEAGVEHTISLVGERGGHQSKAAATKGTTDQVASFHNVTVTDITSKTFRLSWKVPKGAFDSFVLQYRVSTGSARWEERKVQGLFRSTVVKGLSPATEYTVRLYGVSDGRRTEPFTIIATTDKVKPLGLGKLDRLASSNITDRSVQLTWNAERDFDTFLIHYKVTGSKGVQKFRLPGNLRSSIITGLKPSTKYAFYLYGVSSGQRTKPITTIITTTDKDAVKLVSLSTSNVTANSLRLSWTVDRAFDSFLIQYRVQGSEQIQNITVTGGRRSHLIVGLRPATRYTVYLYGISGALRTEPLTTVATTTAQEQPQKSEVSDLSVSNITADSLQLSWLTKREYDSFLVEYGAEEDQEMLSFTVAGDRRSSLITGLRPTTAYTIYLYGVSAGGQRTRPLTAVATTTASTDQVKGKPSKVIKLENLSVSNITVDSCQLSWGAEKVFDSFIIQYGVRGSEDVQNLTVTGDRRLSLITGLRPSTVYIVYVYGISAGVRTKPLTTVITTKASSDQIRVKPSKVIKLENLSVSNVTADSFQLSWGAEKVFDSFIIQYGVRGSEDVQNLTVTSDRRLSLITGLRPSTVYTVYVYGISAGVRTKPLTTVINTKASTDQIKVKPSKVIKLGNLSVSKVTVDSFQLSWGAEKVFDSFIIQYGVRGSEDVQNLTVTGDRRLSLITGLRPSTVYTVYVYGISAGVRTKPLTTVISTKASTDQIKVKPSKVIKLENLSVSNVTADSFQLSWGAEKVIDSFIIQYGVRGSEDVQNLTVAGDRRLSLITGLRPSTVYTVYVYGISAGVRTKPLTTVITTKASTDQIKVKPSKVIKLENLSVSNVTADSFQLSWGAEKVIDSFIIQYGVRGSEDVQNLTVAGDRRLSLITGLRPSTVYTVYVYGISAGVRTKPLTTVITTKASTDQIKIKPSKTIKLENLSVSNITVDSFQLSWAAEKVFDSFIIQYGVRGSEDVQNLTVTGDHRLYLITGLRPSTVYTVYVYGITAGVRTKPLTTEINTKASTEKPSKVKKLGPLLVSNVTADSARLSWPPQQGIDFYMVQYRVRGSAAVHNITVTGDRRFVIITGLKPTTKYLFSLYSVAGGQRKKSLTLQVTTKAPAGRDKLKPSKVTKLGSLSVSNVTSDSIPLSWTAEKGFDAFLIRYKVHGSGAVQNFTVTGDHRSTTITGLRPSTKYTVSVYGVYNGQRTKPLSRVITTKASTHQDAVKLGSLSTSNVTANSLRLSWTADRVFDSFLIQYKLQGSEETQNITVTGGRRSHLIVGLRPATRYTVFLYGISGALRTGPLTTVATTTASADKDTVTPVQLGSLSTSNVTANSLRLSWTVNGTFDSFLIQYKVQGSEETQNITVTGGRRSHLIVGLRPATRYTVYLYGIFNGKRTKPLTAVVSTTVSMDTNGIKPSRLSKLIRLSGNNVTQDSLQIFWAAESGFDSFLIQYRVEGSEELQNFTVPGDQQSSFIRGLRPSTKYLISLYGLSGSRRTRPLTTILTTAASTDNEGVKSGNLGSLSFSNITADSLQLSWTAETVFDSFLIQYKAQGSETLQNITVTGDRRSAYITGLRPTTNYTIYLHGVSDGQLSRPLVALLTITAIPVHTAGFNTLGRLLVSDVDTHSLKLSWTVEEGAFDSFLVQYRDSQGQLEAQEVRVSGNLRDVTIADLRPGTEYLISLYGVLKNQQTEPIPIMARTARESRSRLSFTDLGATSVTVNWEAPSVPVDTFKIFYVPTKQGEPRSVITEGGKTNITLTGLVPATQYEINLVAVRGSIESPPILDHFTTAPDAPSDLKAVNVSQTMALLIWRPAIASIDHYVITYGDGRTVPDASKNVPGNTAELQLTGLSMNTEYTAQIYGVKGGSKSSKLSTTFVTDSDLPRELTVRDISSSEALVSWTAPRAPVTGYLLLYGTGGDVTQRAMLDATATSHRLHHLLPSTGYTVRLHALRGTDRAAAITAPFSTVGAHIPFPKDCGEEHSNGRTESSTVTLYLNGNKDKPIKVYCDMRTDGGGWMVFQRRINGKTNFMRTWKAYVAGFGELAQEHWLGLENLHQLTSQRRYELRVDLRNGNESAYATYDNFVVESAAQKYRLRLGKYAGNAGNSLSYHHGSNFTTLDADNDEALTNCAMSYRGGWWYKNCHRVNLNGEYGNNRDHQGVNWYGWKGFEFSIPFTEMKMRPYNFARVVRKE